MMTRHLFFFLPWLLVFSSPAHSAELPTVDDEKLTRLLNRFEIVAEQQKLPVAVRLLRVREPGECNGAPETCPKETLYIAVSTFDEAPNEKLYILPKAYGWTFINWKVIPKEEGPTHHVVLELEEKIISQTPKTNWWAKRRFDVGVNPWSGYIEPVRSAR